MICYDYSAAKAFTEEIPKLAGGSCFAVMCNPGEVHNIMGMFGWEEDTVDECTNLDETVRYTCYDGYDFVSLLYMEPGNESLIQCEVNIFFSRSYIVLVLPENPGARLTAIAGEITRAFSSAVSRPSPLSYVYYLVFDIFASDYSNSLESLEDEMEALAENIEARPRKEQSVEIGRLRKVAYTYKKLLRALSYIGSQLLMDENRLMGNTQKKYLSNISTRLVKLYDFADNLCSLSNELLHSYDSKFSAQMNETINKLTIITLFFGPLTVIAGIYGMNFVNMPELNWYFGYPAALGLMAVVCVIIYAVLKKNKWM